MTSIIGRDTAKHAPITVQYIYISTHTRLIKAAEAPLAHFRSLSHPRISR